jgi:hypothetical protein
MAYATEDLGMRLVLAKFILWLLTQKQKENCLSVASDLLECVETDDNFLEVS